MVVIRNATCSLSALPVSAPKAASSWKDSVPCMLTHGINNRTHDFAIIIGMELQEDELAGWEAFPQVAVFLGKLQCPLFMCKLPLSLCLS